MTQDIEKPSMSGGAAPAPTPTVNWVARARELAPMIEAAGAKTEQDCKVTSDVMAALHGAELFRMLLPRSIGGGEATPLELMKVLEVVGAADGSTAWCLGQGLGCSIAAAFLDRGVAEDIFAAPDAVGAWGPPAGVAKAVKTDGGYRSSGRWKYASGSPNVTWFGGHSTVCDGDGTPLKDADGGMVRRTMMIPADRVKLHNTWHVIGLRGTGSDDYEVSDLFVAEDHTFWRDNLDELRETGPLYRIPLLTFYGIGFAGVALGIARASLDAFKDLAMDKVAHNRPNALRQSPVIQAELAQAEGKLRSARAFLIEMIEETWEIMQSEGERSLEQKALLRVSITHALNQSREVTTAAYHAAGGTAVFEANPFERRLRDIFSVSQQGQAHLANFEFAGQALMGDIPSHRL
ncbi:MAG: acyl-CoA dehydrogenase [Alphaproteobacteria bacterium]